ncbi:hypothetical protein E2C01_081801 [Portunus trituberculatus]|uniref:Uncharacterized protein n=1 Tax=Portunus trituberculatus TaxID=210409 RepID=A0A5B7IZ34_PORTR|nr:hypothetical protein [Portunus trituberculatus]
MNTTLRHLTPVMKQQTERIHKKRPGKKNLVTKRTLYGISQVERNPTFTAKGVEAKEPNDVQDALMPHML